MFVENGAKPEEHPDVMTLSATAGGIRTGELILDIVVSAKQEHGSMQAMAWKAEADFKRPEKIWFISYAAEEERISALGSFSLSRIRPRYVPAEGQPEESYAKILKTLVKDKLRLISVEVVLGTVCGA